MFWQCLGVKTMGNKEEKKNAKRARREKRRSERIGWREAIKDCFEVLALFIATHPWKVCIISFMFNGLLGLGMLNLPTSKLLNNNIEDLFVPRGSPTQEKATSLLKLFPDTSGFDFYAHQSVKQPLFAEVLLFRHDRSNILNGSSFGEIDQIVKYVKNITTFTINGDYAKYPDVCARRNGDCVVHGEEIVREIKNNTEGIIEMKKLVTKDGSNYENSLTNLAEYVVENDTLKSAGYLKIRFYLRQDSDEMKKDAKLWQDHFITYMKKFIRKQYPKSLHVVFRHAGSFYEELGNDTFMDIPYFSFVFTVFLTYLGILVSGGNIISKRVNIGRMGILVTPISVLGAWGLLMGCGLEFTNTVGVIPLFIQCHQIINSLIVFSHLSDVNHIKDAHKRVAYAIRNSALPITMTTIVHVITFAVGISSKYYVLELVCIYFVATTVFNYFNHLIFFTATLALHEHRIDAELHFCTWNKLTPREQLQEEGRNCCFICCCSGKRPETREDTESGMERVSRKAMSRVLLSAPVRFVTVLFFFGFVIIFVWGLVQYDIDTMQVNQVLPTSYYSNWDRFWAQHFDNESIVQFISIHPQGYTQNKTIIKDFEKSIRSKHFMQPNSVGSWYEAYSASPYQNVSSEVVFMNSVKNEFIPKNPVYKYDLVIDKIRPRVIASRFYMKTSDVPSTKAMIAIKRELNTLADDINDFVEERKDDDDEKDAYPFDWKVDDDKHFIVHSPDFLPTDWYMLPLWELLKLIAVQFSLLFCLSIMLNPSFNLAVHIVVCYFTSIAGIIGISRFFGIHLSPVAMVVYILASSYPVEVIAHTYFSFMQAVGTDKAARMNVVLSTISQALFHTIFGQFLGILVMLVDKSYVFVTLFQVFILATGVCVVYTIFFIPTLITLLGPGEDKLPAESVDSYKFELKSISPATSSNGAKNGAGGSNGVTNHGFQPHI